MKKFHLKQLARVTEFYTCLDLSVCDLPNKVIKQIIKDLKHPKRCKQFFKIKEEAYKKGLFAIPNNEWVTNYDITTKGYDLITSFYSRIGRRSCIII